MINSSLNANVERFQGFALQYDKYRPQPPAVIIDMLTQFAEVPRPKVVVDLGSGTGLSTTIWESRADQVIGIEPSEDMRQQAQIRTADLTNVRFQDGYSTATGLPAGCADIVTCSQSLHWMEPNGTFIEVARLLRPGGVFAAYDCDWPPTMNWAAEAAEREFMGKVAAIEREKQFSSEVKSWEKSQHLSRMAASGLFRDTKEVLVHSVEQGNAERLIGLVLSQGGVATLLKHGLNFGEIGLDTLREAAQRALGDMPRPWYFSYRIRLALK